MTSAQWSEAMDWLDLQLKKEKASLNEVWNDHWNNHIRFCSIVEPYMTLCYSIKHGDIGLLKHAMREICIILQAPSTRKPKYAREMLRQIHIFDTKAADPILQEAYLANALVNPRGLGHTFYEMDLLLEHQNGEFKRFRSDRGSSLQESDEMFRLHALSVDTLRKVRLSLNKTVVGRQRSGYHPTKDASFDILSLADQLHRSRSTHPNGPERGKIFFSENQVPNILKQGKANLHHAIEVYKESVYKNEILSSVIEPNARLLEPLQLPELEGQNESVNELFSQAREDAAVTSDLSELYL